MISGVVTSFSPSVWHTDILYVQKAMHSDSKHHHLGGASTGPQDIRQRRQVFYVPRRSSWLTTPTAALIRISNHLGSLDNGLGMSNDPPTKMDKVCPICEIRAFTQPSWRCSNMRRLFYSGQTSKYSPQR
jgi:hypothetical protein